MDGSLPRQEKGLPEHGGPGVVDGEEHQKGEGKKKVGLGFEGETGEGTLKETLGESRLVTRGSRVEGGTGLDRVSQRGWRVERVVVDD